MQTNLDKDQLQFHQLVCKVFPFPSDISCILMITPSEHVRSRRAHFNFSINQLALAPSFPFKTLTFSLICLIRLTFTFFIFTTICFTTRAKLATFAIFSCFYVCVSRHECLSYFCPPFAGRKVCPYYTVFNCGIFHLEFSCRLICKHYTHIIIAATLFQSGLFTFNVAFLPSFIYIIYVVSHLMAAGTLPSFSRLAFTETNR